MKMENGYVSSPQLPPQAHLSAAAAFQAAAANSAAAAGGAVTPFQEALMSRMGRPFGLSSSDIKDLPGSPFAASLGLAAAAAGGGSRPPGVAGSGMESAFPGGLQLAAAAFQQPFGLHPFAAMDPRLPFSSAAVQAAASGAFRPIFGSSSAAAAAAAAAVASTCGNFSSSVDTITSSSIKKSFSTSSAFQPPLHTATSKHSPPTLFSPGQNLFPRASAGSPGSPSSSPPTSISGSVIGDGNRTSLKALDENSNTAHLMGIGRGNGPPGLTAIDRHVGSISPASMDSNHGSSGAPHDHEQAHGFGHSVDRTAKKPRLSGHGGVSDGVHSSGGSTTGVCCPICGMPLRSCDLEAHYTQELDYLAKLSAALIVSQQNQHNTMKSPIGGQQGHHGIIPGSPGCRSNISQSSPGSGLEVAPRSRWDTFQRIQRNRQSRIRVKLSRRAGKRPDEILEEDIENSSICSPGSVVGHSISQSGSHLHQIQRYPTVTSGSISTTHQPRSTSTPGNPNCGQDDEDIDIVGDHGGPPKNKNHNTSSMSSHSNEGSADGNTNHRTSLSRGEFQTGIYGPPQFTEADVLACMTEAEKEDEDLALNVQNARIKQEVNSGPHSPRSRSNSPKSDNEEGRKNDSQSNKRVLKEIGNENGNDPSRLKEEIEEEDDVNILKEKLRKLEDNSKCSKCMNTLKNPVVNVGCWHIQCQKCWLISLGTKKCCSLCGAATTPSELRKVYL